MKLSKFNFIYRVSKKLKSQQKKTTLFSIMSGTRNREMETSFGDARSVTVRATVSIQAYFYAHKFLAVFAIADDINKQIKCRLDLHFKKKGN